MPKTLPLWLYQNPSQRRFLTSPALPVDIGVETTASFKILIDQMMATMYKANGVGLAAPQIGQSLQLAVIASEVTPDQQPLILINPKIISASQDMDTVEEGCLSIPGVYGLVPRPIQVTVTYMTSDGQPAKVIARDMHARVIQHEIDHLHGRLFIDRATSITKGKDLL